MAKLFGGAAFIFGWAKPVPVNFGNLRNPKRDMFWVAGAGPFANFVMALGLGAAVQGSRRPAARSRATACARWPARAYKST